MDKTHGNEKKIAIDARMIENSGIGSYIKSIIGSGIYCLALGDRNVIKKYAPDIEVFEYHEQIFSVGEQLRFPSGELKRRGIDLIHFPQYNIPITYRGNYVVTVHDLIPVLFPEMQRNKAVAPVAKLLAKNAVRNAKAVFADSENTKKDILKLTAVPESKITVVNCAPDKSFRRLPVKETDYIYDKYGIPEDRIKLLYTGNLRPNKNLPGLFRAFAGTGDCENSCLILTGENYQREELDRLETELKINDRVIHTGFVPHSDLPALYNIADIFVFPSLYEGFGIPPLEAMACGTPVVCSNNSSLPEVVGDAALTFDPYDIASITYALNRMISDSTIREELSIKGLARAESFQREEPAAAIRSVISNI